MLSIKANDFYMKYPGYFNIYPITNEISLHSSFKPSIAHVEEAFFLDENYGRLIKEDVNTPYGDTGSMEFYTNFSNLEVVEELRVPNRRIPVYKYTNPQQASDIVNQLQKTYSNFEILIRGQTNLYTIARTNSEKGRFFGKEMVKEPSFMPSFLRSNFNEYFINGLWYSQTAFMLENIGHRLTKVLTDLQLKEYYEDVCKIKTTPYFTPIALGTAQHYGLPSIGLDLTDSFEVAAWFAAHKFSTNEFGNTKVYPLDDFSESTIFIFRCPKDSVFSHNIIKPKFIYNTRPDRQNAWFSHVGWGYAKNQLASYLACGIRLDKNVLNIFRQKFEEYLFPDRRQDLVLNYFLDVRNNHKNIGEVQRALSKIYYLD